jgi:RNA polymerase subunit RPABC4/transcription elongation factor Spt4
MPMANQTSTRFRDEIRSISPWVFFLAAAICLTTGIAFVVVIGKDHSAPPLPLRCLLGTICGVLFGCYVVLIGYINQDSGRRGMSRLLWTLIAMFVPNGLGIVLYFVLRKPRAVCCPQCNATLEANFSFCPSCRYHLKPACPHCQRSVNPGDKFCPYCGVSLEASGQSTVLTTPQT